MFFNPTRIFFGPGEMNRLGKEARKFGKKALLIKTEGPLEKMGVFARATGLMQAEGMEVYDLEGISANPRFSKIEEGIRICKEKGIDIVVPVGGGSAIDSAKAIAFGVFQQGDLWEFFVNNKKEVKNSLPIGAVSTIAATGSEMNYNCIVTNDRDSDKRNWMKWATHYEVSYPKFAILDPELHKSVPAYLTAAGMVDIMSHVMEGYFEAGDDATRLQDRFAESVMISVIENDGVLKDPGNIEYRSNLSWAAGVALIGIVDAGRENRNYFSAHMIEHALGELTDCTHGAGLAIIHPAWLYFLNKKNSRRFIQFAERVLGMEQGSKSDDEFARKGIDTLKARFIEWGMPVTLSELGADRGIIHDIADSVMRNPEVHHLLKQDIISVLESCFD